MKRLTKTIFAGLISAVLLATATVSVSADDTIVGTIDEVSTDITADLEVGESDTIVGEYEDGTEAAGDIEITDGIDSSVEVGASSGNNPGTGAVTPVAELATAGVAGAIALFAAIALRKK